MTHLTRFYDSLYTIYSRTCCGPESVVYLAHTVLMSPPEGHSLRSFRRHLARRYGSTISGWRRLAGDSRLLDFETLREACQELKCRDHAPEYWDEMDSGRAGTISLFELDPEATMLLVKMHRVRRTRSPGSPSTWGS